MVCAGWKAGVREAGERLPEGEVDALLYGVVFAAQRGHQRIVTGRGGRPALVVHDGILDIEHPVPHGLREHPSGAPPPHLAPRLVEHHEVVGAAVGEIELHPLAGVVGHFNGKPDHAARGVNHDMRRDPFPRSPRGAHQCGRVWCARTTRKHEPGGNKQRNNDARRHQGVDGWSVTLATCAIVRYDMHLANALSHNALMATLSTRSAAVKHEFRAKCRCGFTFTHL